MSVPDDRPLPDPDALYVVCDDCGRLLPCVDHAPVVVLLDHHHSWGGMQVDGRRLTPCQRAQLRRTA